MMRLMRRALRLQSDLEELGKRLGKGKYGRVLKMARKPTKDEYSKTLQVTGAGIIIVGALGFLIYLLWREMPRLFRTLLGT